jgi:amino acid transporter
VTSTTQEPVQGPADPDGPVRLKANAVGSVGAVIMSAAIMGPAVSTFFNPQFSTPFSGAATPFVYFACLVAILIASSGLVAMAGRLPSAGAFYTYVTRGLGPRAGFVTGGLMFVAYALLPPAEIGLIGSYLQSTFKAEWNVNIPWWLIGLVPAAFMIYLAYEGITSSIRTAMVLFTAEVIVVMLIAIIIVIKGGAHGLTLKPLSPTASPHGFNGLVTGFVFAALSFVGFEGASTLSEEVREPKKTVPRAILISCVVVGLIYLFCTWAEVNGLGIAGANKLTGSATPWNDLAATFAPWMKWFIIIASVSSMFAVMVNSNNGIIRIFYAMGREGLLPGWLADVHPKRRTPTKAVLAVGAFAIVLALVVGAVSGGFGDAATGSLVYGYLGYVLTLGILPVYVLTNLAAVRYLWGKDGFNPLKHLILPLLGAGLMVALLIGQIIENSTQPFKSFPWVVVAWVVVVAIAAFVIGNRRPQTLAVAGSVLATGEADDDGTHPELPGNEYTLEHG